MKKIFCILLLLISAFHIQAEDIITNKMVFSVANEAYQNDAYSDALEGYQQIWDNGSSSFELYYNMGNCHFRLGNYVEAVWHYEMAKKITPNDEDVQANIALVNRQFVDEIKALPSIPFSIWWNGFIYGNGASFWYGMSLLALLACMLFALSFWLNDPFKSILKYFSLPALVIGLLSFFTAMAVQSHFENAQDAILLSSNADVLSEPSSNALELFTIHAGLKMEVLEQNKNWSEIKIASGEVGWLKNETMRLVQ
jgi:tetratricopeptide (TPR) repeat protein